MLGIVIGCVTVTRMGDTKGRKPIYQSGIILHLFVMAILLFSTDVRLDFVALFFLGVSVTMKEYVGYTYNIEMQPSSSKVLASTLQFVFEAVAFIIVCLYFLLVSKDWRYL